MCRKERVYRHLPERVKRQFAFVQDIPRYPSNVAEMPKDVLIDPVEWFYPNWRQMCQRAWHHEPGYMAWYAKVSHPRILPPDEGSLPRSANVDQIIEKMPNTLTIIRDVVMIVDNIMARSGEMTKEEIVQDVIQIGSTGRPALTYQIARQRRGQRHRRQQG